MRALYDIDQAILSCVDPETGEILDVEMLDALQMERDPAELRADVCSPGGSSIEGIAVMEERALRSAVIEAIRAAYHRTMELGKEAEQQC